MSKTAAMHNGWVTDCKPVIESSILSAASNGEEEITQVNVLGSSIVIR